MTTILVALFISMVILAITRTIMIYKLEKRNLFLSTQLEAKGVDLASQEEKYKEMIMKARSSDSLSKLRKMKISHYAALQHINGIIRENFYVVKPPHRQPVLKG